MFVRLFCGVHQQDEVEEMDYLGTALSCKIWPSVDIKGNDWYLWERKHMPQEQFF